VHKKVGWMGHLKVAMMVAMMVDLMEFELVERLELL
jgi:hypothetical protein